MSGVSLVVLGLALRASEHHTLHTTAAAPAGVVGAPVTPTPLLTSTAPTRAPKPTPTPRPAPKALAPVVRPSATSVPSHSSSPRAVRTTVAPTPSTVTVNGAPADTQYGPVQVQITLRGGHIVAANAIEYPSSGSRDQEINSQAIPQLNDETVQADSAQIDTVSGATYTSDGYRRSLQSALDAAHKAGAR
jgi:uncharacterized protein with FMN-binding domain